MAAKLASRDAAAREAMKIRDVNGRELIRTLAYRYITKKSGALGLKKRFEWRVKKESA